MTNTATGAARTAKNSHALEILARTGFAVLGLLHVLIGGIAIGLVVGAGSGDSADQSGALKQLSSQPGGIVVIWVVAIGMFALLLWQIVQVFLQDDADEKKRWAKRAKELGKGVAYGAVGATALTFALGGSSDSADSSQGLSATLLAHPGGVILLVVVGLVVAGLGVAFAVQGVLTKFEKLLVIPAGSLGAFVRGLGITGYVAKGVALFVVGVLFVVAAVTADPEKASGMDGALKALVQLPFGQVILVIVGAGLIAYGLFCAARARWAKL
ncbi:DUF1206 domain-containing protein [Agreia sp. COWG]|uniref:DUF1206 domain-containing protein n=1 Tax=Agreia sp. COWG TaxID=2773266 RepID=UPI001925FE3E|nr:DUF1206 domain-containing protein [Agreia sp. COWG]CAD6006859.1 conserved membrane protein of unknown function [Agreia sp. COWG]